MASVLPESIHCTVRDDAGPVAGLFVIARFGMGHKNDYDLILGPTNSTGETHITRDEIIAKADREAAWAIMDYVSIEGCFSGSVRVKLLSRQGIHRALTGCEDFGLGRHLRKELLVATRVIESLDPKALVLEARASPPDTRLSVLARLEEDRRAESMLDPGGTALWALTGCRNIRALRHGVPVWRIKAGGFWGRLVGGGAGFERRRRAVLASVFHQFPRLYFMGDPTEFNAGAEEWLKAAKGVWALPVERDVHLFHSRAYVGNWRLFVSDVPRFPEELSSLLYRASDPDAILDWMDRGSIRFLLDSWYDNVFWTVAVGRRVSG